ncbi:MAG: hypothetical protein H8K09_13140 [Nitrospira sp.]|nr:hypothetical protein [Nitrospira sp.]
MTRRIAWVLSLVLLGASPAMAQVWPNEPAGSANVFDCTMAHLLCNGLLTDNYNTTGLNASPPSAFSVVSGSDASELVSPPSALVSKIAQGQLTGGTELTRYLGTNRREIYVGIDWRTNLGFQGRTVGNKMVLIRGPGVNHVFLFGNSSLVNGQAPLIFAHNTGAPSYPGFSENHACPAFALGEACYPNVGPGILHVGPPWQKLEFYLRSSTTSTSRDGIVRAWIDGVPALNYTNLNVAPNGFDNVTWSETWDGSPCCTFVTSADGWQHWIGHWRISFPNCPSGCAPTGGGGTAPPPPPPPLPPNKPTNLRVQ